MDSEYEQTGTGPGSKELSRLIGDLGHEVATPLASILLTCEMLADNTQGNLTERQLRSLGNLIQAADEVQRLMKRVVLLTRLATGSLRFEADSFPFDLLIEEIASGHPSLKLKALPPLPESLRSDRLRLRELIDLMVQFAQRYDPEPELRVASWPEGSLSFTLRANGSLPEEKIANALDPFGPAGLKAARHAGGPGLELAIAAQLATTLGGRFEIADRKDGKITLAAVFPLPEGLK